MRTPATTIPEGNTSQGKKTFVNAKPGKCRAWLYGMEDFGTQENYFDPTAKPQRALRLRFELVDQLMDDGKPVIIMEKLTFKLWHDEKKDMKTKIVKWIDSWFDGAGFDGCTTTDFGFIEGFDWNKLYKVPVELTVIDNGGYSKITKVDRVRNLEGMTERVNPILELSLEKDLFDKTVFDNLSEKTRASIMLSPEYKLLSEDQRKPKDDVADVFEKASEMIVETGEEIAF